MFRKLALVALLLFASEAVAQQQCVCTAGCKIASDPYPPSGPTPTSCTVYKAGVAIANSPFANSSTIPASNATVCSPASPTYPVIAGGIACEVVIPAQPAGSVTLTMTATNAQGESAQSAAFTFTSVAVLLTVPGTPVNLRPN